MDSVVEAIRRHLRENPGNNLIYCPSLAYLDQLHQKLTALAIPSFAQLAGMAESGANRSWLNFTNGTGSVGRRARSASARWRVVRRTISNSWIVCLGLGAH
jgi:hypothetical protein